ncbi:ketoacyl-ACP synthase III [Streptomyces phaeofaciens JCM 4814]|uniref:3-oxoacyl-[acyl-carrier-protein] synthase 3 n=1 Tax=Streptomyces phaeofaciens TaxID=68254 RepID=A0A918H691_9ACTN|nr:beta-ketoacyl-ACP synthase 3 [Streptomyces phaeofaciens]GGT36340.1 3-oxoacyl-[acyl-carrier-protein] synthase 3 [Streptomyces phaeofaciens]
MSTHHGTRSDGLAVGIASIGSYVPPNVITNAELAGPAGVTEDWIVRKTGIHTRRRAGAEQATSDLAAEAARQALAKAGLRAADLSLVIVGTTTPDVLGPAVACQVADQLGCDTNTAAFDVHAACSGFLTGLATAEKFLLGSSGGTPGHALVIGADAYTRFLDPADRRTVVLWGDGAGAVVLGPAAEGRPRILATKLLSDGSIAGLATIPAGGSRRPATHETVDGRAHYVHMDGRSVSAALQEAVPGMLDDFLKENGVEKSEIAHVVMHQGNANLVAHLTGMLGLEQARAHLTAPVYGNTGSASIPVTLDQAVREDAVRPGDLVLMIAFGAGLTYAFTLLRW